MTSMQQFFDQLFLQSSEKQDDYMQKLEELCHESCESLKNLSNGLIWEIWS
jgi:hypothetical protein